MSNSVTPTDPATGRKALGGRARTTHSNIYIAGKIEKHDWRGLFVPGLDRAVRDSDLYSDGYAALDRAIEITPGLNYVGPFFVSCDHGCGHHDGNHGVVGGCINRPDPCDCGHDGSCCEGHSSPDVRSSVAKKCFEQIARASAVIALIADDAHGTLVEVGYALGVGKRVVVTSSIDCANASDGDLLGEAWFPFHAPGVIERCCVSCTINAMGRIVGHRAEESLCESPVELAFLRSMRIHSALWQFKPNVKVMGGKYRIDFADVERMVGIEIDGHAYHSDKESFARDRVRQRELEIEGWRLVRYSGQEVHRDADACVNDLLAWLAATS